jgi:uncharacterized OB-fold protein
VNDTGSHPHLPIWQNLYGEDALGPYLVGSRCRHCGALALGARDICAQCWSEGAMEPVPVGRAGRLYSFTVMHQVPEGFSAPMAVGYIDLADGLRAFAHLARDPATLTIGTELALSLVALRKGADGRMLTGPLYASKSGTAEADP